MTKISIIGAGAWGTALAVTAAYAGNDVHIIGNERESIDTINNEHENKLRLPGVKLSSKIKASLRYTSLKSANLLLMATPAQATREVLETIKNYITKDCYIIICSKGIELNTRMLLSDVLEEIIPHQPFGILSGPAFAKPLAMGLSSACTLATNSLTSGRWLASTLSYKNFRLYPTDDVIGTQVGGALKNVIAIAVGICDGLGLSENTRAMLMTRGLHEIARFGTALGGKPQTFMGLSGLGDLILTCSASSRNYSFGYALGKGQNLQKLLQDQSTTREGILTALAAKTIAQEKHVDAPVTLGICQIIEGSSETDQVVQTLLDRPLRAEERS